ncbi:MAG: major tail protein [Candidatus Ornithomonoglobus sp.]
MANTNRKPMPTIGIDMYHYFPIASEAEDGAITYGAAVALPGVTQISPSDSGGNAVFDADNGAYCNVSYLENLGHELTNADIPEETDAAWRGLELGANGVLEVGEPKTVYFGVAWRQKKADGTYRYVRYYKGSYSFASNTGGQTQPSSGAPEFQTATATFSAVKRDSDGKYYGYIDQTKVEELGIALATFEEQWFSDPTYSPEKTAEA